MAFAYILATYIGLFMIEVLLIITILLGAAIVYIKWCHTYWKRRRLPHLQPAIPFGTLQNPSKRVCALAEEFRNFYGKAKARGWKYCGLYSMATPTFLLIDLDLIKNVMSKDFQYFVDKGLYTNDKDDPIGSHIFNIGGSQWRNLRVKLTPTFTSGKMRAMFHNLVTCAEMLDAFLDESISDNTGTIDLKDVLERFTADVIGTVAFGLQCNSLQKTDSLFHFYARRFFRMSRLESLRLLFCINCPKIARALGMLTMPKDISRFFTKMVEDTVEYREKNNLERRDFLQLLIDMKKGGPQQNGYKDDNSLTMHEIVAQSFIFFAAGYETSAATMSFALYQLAINQEIQENVRKEIKSVLAEHGEEITYDTINELKYLGQVIDETLRMYPPLPVLPRRCVRDYRIPGTDVVIEEGTRVQIPVYGLHYDEELYENPHVFDPERFAEENKKSRHPFSYIPFGAGPRICIGMRFGLMQTKLGLTSILRKFRVTLNERTKVPLEMETTSITVMVKGGMWLNLERIGS